MIFMVIFIDINSNIYNLSINNLSLILIKYETINLFIN
jgi:hypothetical protein